MLVALTKEIKWADVLKGSVIVVITSYALVYLLFPSKAVVYAIPLPFILGGIYVGRKQVSLPKTHGFLTGVFGGLMTNFIALVISYYLSGKSGVPSLFLSGSLAIVSAITFGGLFGFLGGYVGSKFVE